MTYQDVVNRIQTIVNNHYQLADFGYGDLSDLKTRFENTSGDSAVQADYPYLFLNPGVHNRNLTTMTYNFNMLVMDMARGEVADQPYNNILAIQSQCQQMIDDVLADLYYGFTDQPEVMRANMSYTPFNERFQDDVAGMTASLSIEVPTGLNLCVAPLAHYNELVTWRADAESTIDFSFDPQPDVENDQIRMFTYSYDGNAPFTANTSEPTVISTYHSIQPSVTGRYKLKFNLLTKWNEPEDGSGLLKYGIQIIANGSTFAQKISTTQWTSAETVVPITHSFELDLIAGTEYYYYYDDSYAITPTADILGYQLAGSKLTISKAQ
tara:strand:- start:846 stop:1817 length:972 start_codon:yes stop_codon:yes gene_type:complete